MGLQGPHRSPPNITNSKTGCKPVPSGVLTASTIRCETDDSMNILFLKAWHSVPGGVKPSYLATHGHKVINSALSDEDWNEP